MYFDLKSALSPKEKVLKIKDVFWLKISTFLQRKDAENWHQFLLTITQTRYENPMYAPWIVSEKNGSICYVTTIWFVFPASRFPLTSPNCHIHLAHCPPIVSAMPTTSTAPTASAVPLDVLKASISDDYIHTYYARPVRWQQDCAGRQISRKEEMVR